MTGPKRAPIYHADCIEIVLTNGRSTFVDLDCPADVLAQTWRALANGYVLATMGKRPSRQTVYMHRMLLRGEVEGLDVANCGPRAGQFRGVSWCSRLGKWIARLSWRDTNNRAGSKHLGLFNTAEEAAHAWDAAALASKRYDPEFLYLNFPHLYTQRSS